MQSQKVATTLNQLFLTENQVSKRWQLSTKTLQLWRAKGWGPKFIKYGPGIRGLVRYRLSDIEEWERQQEREGGSVATIA
jgi:predicted DNA-binding transcriptional regulator AlpA